MFYSLTFRIAAAIGIILFPAISLIFFGECFVNNDFAIYHHTKSLKLKFNKMAIGYRISLILAIISLGSLIMSLVIG